jgi:membrane protein implicated in regulation of membrane protease activity
MPMWLIWTIVAVACAGAEALTLTLILGFIAAAAALTLIAAVLGAPIVAQLLVFVGSAAALLGVVRPIARAHLYTPPALRTGVDALVGQRGLVVERVDAHHGQIKIGGELWSARPYVDGQCYEPGTTVEVVKIQGAIALVFGTE